MLNSRLTVKLLLCPNYAICCALRTEIGEEFLPRTRLCADLIEPCNQAPSSSR
jgi:hypothetical protein